VAARRPTGRQTIENATLYARHDLAFPLPDEGQQLIGQPDAELRTGRNATERLADLDSSHQQLGHTHVDACRLGFSAAEPPPLG
jgi:hypothetical protein